jgi:hypothetical protein
MRSRTVFVFALLICAVIAVGSAQAATFHVNCSSTGQEDEDSLRSIGAAIARLGRGDPSTIVVNGACTENVVIQSVDRLTINALAGASITDASAGTAAVISIADSRGIFVTGFSVTGGGTSIVCGDHSTCSFSGNSIQNSSGDGLVVTNGSSADSVGDVFHNNAGRGLVVSYASSAIVTNATVTNNGVPFGETNIRLRNHASLALRNSTVQGSVYVGIRLTDHSTLELVDNVITANTFSGVSLESSSEATFDANVTGNTINANSGGGVLLYDVSLANFTTGQDTITGNGNKDVYCSGSHAFATGLANLKAATTTNCTAP